MPYANTSGFDFFEVLSSFSGKTKKNDFHDWYPLLQGDDPACLREFLLPILCRNSPSGNIGLQVKNCVSSNLLAFHFLELSDILFVIYELFPFVLDA